jgi:hypothetical protein
VRPLAITFGEFINDFFCALTKDLSFYQYMPLMTLVTVVLVPFSIYFMSLLSLLLFNYEFNFFHLISFKKGHQQQQQQAHPVTVKPNPEAIEAAEKQKKEMLKLLSMIKGETRRLAYKFENISSEKSNLASNINDAMRNVNQYQLQNQQAIQYCAVSSSFSDYESNHNKNVSQVDEAGSSSFEEEDQPEQDLNKTFESVRGYFEKISSKEDELQKHVEKLQSENQRLAEMLHNNSTTKELLMLNESGDFTNGNNNESSSNNNDDNNSSESADKPDGKKDDVKVLTPTSSSRQVSIGLSRTVVASSKMSSPLGRLDQSQQEMPPFASDKVKLMRHERRGASNQQQQQQQQSSSHFNRHDHENDVDEDEDDEEDIYVILDEN